MTENVGCQQDREVLVRYDAVQGGAGDDGRCDQAGAGAGEGRQEVGQVRNHAAGLHAGAEAHRTKDQEHRVEHAHHAARDQQAVHLGMARFQGNRIVYSLHRACQHDAGAGAFRDFRADAFDDSGLEQEGGGRCDQDGDREDRQRRHPPGDQHDGEDGHDEQPGGDVELRGQDRGVEFGLDRTSAGMRQAENREDDQRDGHGRDRRDHHVADVREQGDFADGRGHHGSVRQGRDLVAEIGPGDDGTGDHAVGETFGAADAQEGDADGGDGGP